MTDQHMAALLLMLMKTAGLAIDILLEVAKLQRSDEVRDSMVLIAWLESRKFSAPRFLQSWTRICTC